jgi:sugar O-acyltransferase (sialic acid O-acetyltransferase NeuD family)
MIKSQILVPLLNTNEPETHLAGVHVRDGTRVKKGDILFTLETTKVTEDIESPVEGYVHLLAPEGSVLQVGDRLAVITEKKTDRLDLDLVSATQGIPLKSDDSTPQLRITKPARLLAESLGLELSSLPKDQLITEEVVRSLAGKGAFIISINESGKPHILIFGGGGHAKTLIDMIRTLNTYSIAGIVDDGIPAGGMILGVPVLGSRDVLSQIFSQGVRLAVNAVGGINDINARVKVFDLLEKHLFGLPSLIHPQAVVEPSAQIGEGVQVFANAYIGSDAVLQDKCMVNTGAVVSHDCEIGKFTHIAPGALLAGHVHVGEKTLVGMGASTNISVVIGSNARIGNLANLLADVPDGMIIQAGRFWVGKTRAAE